MQTITTNDLAARAAGIMRHLPELAGHVNLSDTDDRSMNPNTYTDGESSVWYRTEKGRIVVRGSLEGALSRHRPYMIDGERAEMPRVTVSPDKGDTAIATDIRRRFLPGFLAYVAAARGERRAGEARRDACGTAAARIEAAGGGVLRPMMPFGQADETRRKLSISPLVPGYGLFEVGPESAEISIRGIPHDLAERVAALLADHYAEAK